MAPGHGGLGDLRHGLRLGAGDGLSLVCYDAACAFSLYSAWFCFAPPAPKRLFFGALPQKPPSLNSASVPCLPGTLTAMAWMILSSARLALMTGAARFTSITAASTACLS